MDFLNPFCNWTGGENSGANDVNGWLFSIELILLLYIIYLVPAFIYRQVSGAKMPEDEPAWTFTMCIIFVCFYFPLALISYVKQ